MLSNAYLITGELLGAVGLSYLSWKYFIPFFKAKKFKRSDLYQQMIEITHEHQECVINANSECWHVKGNKFYIKETVSAEKFLMMEKRNLFNDEASDRFILGIIIKHIKHKPECFIDFLECAKKYTYLRQKTNQKILDLLKRCGVPNRFERKLITQDTDEAINQFGVVIDFSIKSQSGCLHKSIELPCDYIMWALEKYKRLHEVGN